MTAGPPAGQAGRRFVIELPPGLPMLSLNGRYHWTERNRRGQAIKAVTWALACRAGAALPKGMTGVRIAVLWRPPYLNRRRDHDNVATASGKYAIDGLVAAGVLPDDCPPHVLQPIGYGVDTARPVPGGQLVVTITEGDTDG